MKKTQISTTVMFLLMILIASICFLPACSSTKPASTSGSGKDSSASATTTEAPIDSSMDDKAISADTASKAEEASDTDAPPEGEAAAAVSSEAEAEPSISFTATDLQGNAVRSDEIFGKNRLTMVNLWGTYCGPCIDEMPELEELNNRLKDKGCAVIGVVIDVLNIDDGETIRAAEEIMAKTGVTYINLLPWDGIFDEFPVQFIPTSYLVDTEGRIVGEPAVGARGADDYEALIDAALAAE